MNTEESPVLWREAKVCEVTGLTPRGVRNRERDGKFPKHVPLDARQKAYVASEVVAWVQQQIADRDAGIRPAGYESVVAARRRGGQSTAVKSQPVQLRRAA